MLARSALLAVVVVSLLTPSAGHAVLITPTPRTNMVDLNGNVISPGTKLQPFGDARNQANRGCGGTNNLDPGVQRPKAVYRPGEVVRVEWQLTIPHPLDNIDTGFRVAIHYGPGDSFEQNILLGGVDGDPNFDDRTGDGIIDRAQPAGGPNSLSNEIQATIVTLPAGKTCNYCTLQWIWAARQDGGFYMGCADIAVTNDGLLPNFALLPPETGELPQNNPNQGGGGGGGNGNGLSANGLGNGLGSIGGEIGQLPIGRNGLGGSLGLLPSGGLPPSQLPPSQLPPSQLPPTSQPVGGVPHELLCPISHELMHDPVLAADGHAYERSCIEEWLSRQRTSPLTGEPLPTTNLLPCHTLKNMAAAYMRSSGHGRH